MCDSEKIKTLNSTLTRRIDIYSDISDMEPFTLVDKGIVHT